VKTGADFCYGANTKYATCVQKLMAGQLPHGTKQKINEKKEPARIRKVRDSLKSVWQMIRMP